MNDDWKEHEIKQAYFEGERPLFGERDLCIKDAIFAEGESPLKESSNIELKGSSFQWKYPLWYSKNVKVDDCTWFEMCYIDNLVMKNCKLLHTTLAFEYSTVDVEVCGKIDSILNPTSGIIRADSIGELILETDRVNAEDTQILCPKIEKVSDHFQAEKRNRV